MASVSMHAMNLLAHATPAVGEGAAAAVWCDHTGVCGVLAAP